MTYQDKEIQKKPGKAVAANVESNTETLLWYEKSGFAQYTAFESNTTCGTTI
ncbi:hypothetical protein KBF38_23945 [bacterium]|nr:hypothetical protein [bacterium]